MHDTQRENMQKIDTRIKNTSLQKGNMPTNVYAARATHHTRILDQHRRKRDTCQTDVENTSVQLGTKMGNAPKWNAPNWHRAKLKRAELGPRQSATRQTGTRQTDARQRETRQTGT